MPTKLDSESQLGRDFLGDIRPKPNRKAMYLI
jgi:hypothetical protein